MKPNLCNGSGSSSLDDTYAAYQTPPHTKLPDVVLVLGACLGSEPFIVDLLRLGAQVVVLDRKPIISSELINSPLGQRLTVIAQDLADLKAVEAAIARYQVTHSIALPVGRALLYLGAINAKYHYEGPRPQAIDQCSDKHKFQHLLIEHQLPAPDYLVLPPRSSSVPPSPDTNLGFTPAELDLITARLAFPLIVKPSLGSGSKCVALCTKRADLAAYRIHPHFSTNEILVQAALEGPEYLLNFFVDNAGQIYPIGLYGKEMSPPPQRQEIAYLVDDYSEVFAYIEPVVTKLVAALGPECYNSFFQCDVIVDPKGDAYLIDVSPRLTGNLIFLLEQRYSVNPIALYGRYILQHQPIEPLAQQHQLPPCPTKAVLRFFSFKQHGTVKANQPQMSAAERQHLVLEHNNLKVGDKVGPMVNGNDVARGVILVEHHDLAEAQRISQHYLDSIELE
mgnify:CR=1 FL=1